MGRKAKKATATAAEARASAPPTPWPAATRASVRVGCSRRSARQRTLNWMPKSTPSPTNSGMKATEIRLNRPTAASPSAAVMVSPTTVVSRMATIIRTDLTANHSMSSMETSIVPVISPTCCFSDENCSSFNGTEPVSRTRTPWAASRFSPAAMAWMASLDFWPGCSAP